MSLLSRNVLYYGCDEPLPERREWHAGPLSLIYEAGDLRYVRLGDREILRRVYVAVRDSNWGAVPSQLSNVQVDVAGDAFHITYDVENKQGDIDFFWQGTLTGNTQGRITFTMDGKARSTFWRNRIGFCVLHPIRECAGQPCTVEKVDRTVEVGRFPQYIAPHQPFMDIRAIAYQVIPGVWAEVRFAGDVFEMEDQRNWSDASYKTYCTPLALPFPVEVKAGTEISQSVTLTLKGEVLKAQARTTDTGIDFSVGPSPTGPLPRIGLGLASHGQSLSQKELARLSALHLAHLRVDLGSGQPGYEAVLGRASAEAGALGIPLEIALILSDAADDELKAFVQVLERVKPAVCAWLILHKREKSTTAKWIRLARTYLAGYSPAAKVGAGTNVYFTELNRGRPPVQELDLVSYSLNPQVHAFDNASLVETLETQRWAVASARQFTGDVPLAISPVTLKPRFNPDATGPTPQLGLGELPPQVDVRQMSLFGAGWTTGNLKYVAESGVYSVTCYETTGWRGVMETEAGSPLPDQFRSLPGSAFPLYHVLADVGQFAGGVVIPTASSDTLKVDGLAVSKDDRTLVIVANLSSESQHVTLRNLGGEARVRTLDETNVEDAMQWPEVFRAQEGERMSTSAGALELTLLPYAVARIVAIA